jgi:hypothetical protein
VTKLDTQGWIDAETAKGQPFAFFVRDEVLWVRRGYKYKKTQLGGSDTIAAARALASIIAGETKYWEDEAWAIKRGLPSD